VDKVARAYDAKNIVKFSRNC